MGLTASMHFSLGLALMQMNLPAEASRQMRQCLAKRDQPSLSPVNREIKKAAPWHCLAVCLRSLRQPAEAGNAFASALKEDDTSRPLRYDYSGFLADQGQPLEAIKVLHQLTGEEPGDVSAWLRGGRIALSKPEFVSFAADWTGEAIKLFPADPGVRLLRAEALTMIQDTPGALQLWQSLSLPSNARQLAAKLICQLADGQEVHLEPSFEPAVSQEFIAWYRALIAVGADKLVLTINSCLNQICQVLPRAGKILEQALDEAQNEAVI
jgi:tetratricopeptide (TPR) repeat protein